MTVVNAKAAWDAATRAEAQNAGRRSLARTIKARVCDRDAGLAENINHREGYVGWTN